MSSRFVLAVCCLTTIFCLPHAGYADTINITSGLLIVESFMHGSFDLVGDARGFTFIGGVGAPPASHFFGPAGCTPCLPGTAVGVGILQDFSDLHGSVTLDGLGYTTGTGVSNVPFAGVLFSGPGMVMPALTGAPIVLTSPFAFSGFFSSGENPAQHSAGFAGEGVAAFTFVPWPGDSRSWVFQSGRYEFTPIPEPATGLLLFTGILGVARRRSRGVVLK